MLTSTVAALTILCFLGYFLARHRVVKMTASNGARRHSLPSYHGAFVVLWTGIPSALLVILWLLLADNVINALLLASMPESFVAPLDSSQRALLLGEIHNVARGLIFAEPAPEVAAAAERLSGWQGLARWAMFGAALAIALGGLTLATRFVAPQFRARHGVERVLTGFMIFCSVVAILTTTGIVVSLVFESLRFFDKVPFIDFFFGMRWEPQIPLREDQVAGLGAFGAVPVFWGTIVIAVCAMAVATPIGLFAAIYLAEYADPRVRKGLKPLLELLAGIPTVVYGFFAVLTVAPAMRDAGAALGLSVAPNSAIVAGGVMGIMLIPFISSIADDAITAVPSAMRDGSYALGATQSETIVQVILPAALPGIVSGILLAVSRAIGETMIVVMAAGLIASMTLNPFESVTTVTVQIVTLLIGDTEFDNPKTLAAFALGLVLFVSTLCLNVLALRIVQRYRERYE